MDFFESRCTIYTREKTGVYTRQVANCHWEDTRGVNFSRTGEADADAALVIIPLDSVELPVLSGKGTKQNYLLRGEHPDEVTAETLSGFLAGHDVFTITAIERNDFSFGLATNHWAVYAK